MKSVSAEYVKEFIAGSYALDAHFDLACDLDARRLQGERSVFAARHAPLLKAGGWKCLVSSVFIPGVFVPELALRNALDQISSLYAESEEGGFSVCRTMAAADAANADGRFAVLLSLEGAEPVGNDLSLLRVFHMLGVRLLGLAWSRRNYACDGCTFKPLREGTKGGLTAFGAELVTEAERLGMIIDISHLNDEGVRDLAQLTRGPIIASHSNSRELTPVMRNLTDGQVRFVAERGGVVGANGCSAFVSGDDRADIGAEELFCHIDHIVRLVGEDHAGLGLDCCDRIAAYAPGPPNVVCYDSIADHSRLPSLVEVMFKSGYSEERVRKIIGGNFRRVFEEAFG